MITPSTSARQAAVDAIPERPVVEPRYRPRYDDCPGCDGMDYR